ncbi:g12667 [Coccomyxa viridis]|uniref:G12667 protein n=1 Tax=Coccomyxa viridis TaxID=1274662 RepID=A0ABP1GAW2_9CHLO
MELLRYRTPVGLSSRLQQQQYTEPKRCFSVSPRYNRHRRSCRSTKTETITRAPPDDEQKQIQHGSSDSNGDSHQWDAQENLVNLITALPIPSPQEVLDSASSPVPQPLEDVPEKVAETVRQAPGLLRRFWRAYVTQLDKRPIAVKSATSFFGFMIGDLLAQTITGHGAYDVFRTLRLLASAGLRPMQVACGASLDRLIGHVWYTLLDGNMFPKESNRAMLLGHVAFGVTLDGPIGHVWYTLLDGKVFPNEPTSNRAVVCKMLLDQLLWAPFFSCVFFVFTNVLAGHPEAVLPSIQAKLLPMMIANFAVWPIAHLINFKFIPSQQRILYINCCQILWSAYLSNLSAGGRKTA